MIESQCYPGCSCIVCQCSLFAKLLRMWNILVARQLAITCQHILWFCVSFKNLWHYIVDIFVANIEACKFSSILLLCVQSRSVHNIHHEFKDCGCKAISYNTSANLYVWTLDVNDVKTISAKPAYARYLDIFTRSALQYLPMTVYLFNHCLSVPNIIGIYDANNGLD